jgi:hypothetical protein
MSNQSYSLKFKSSLTSGGNLSLAHPDSPIGPMGDSVSGAIIYQVTDIPSDVPKAKVQQLANTTLILGGYTARFDQLGVGAIIRCSAAE